MPVYNLENGTLQDREKLLESTDPEKVAEKQGVKLTKFEDMNELKHYLKDRFEDSSVQHSEKLAEMAAMRLKPAVEGRDRRILYPEID